MFNHEYDEHIISDLEKDANPIKKLRVFAEKEGYFWSLGTHPEWKYDARVWKPYKDRLGKRRIPTHIGIGNSLQDAVLMCISKGKLKFDI